MRIASRSQENVGGTGKRAGSLKLKEISQSVQLIVGHFVSQFIDREDPSRDLTGLHEMIMDSVEVQLLTQTMKLCDGNKVRAAAVLGIHRNTLAQKLALHEEKLPHATQKYKKFVRAGIRRRKEPRA